MNIDANNILNKMLGNGAKRDVTRIYIMSTWILTQEYKGHLMFEKSANVIHHIHKLKNKDYPMIAIDAERHLTKPNIHSEYELLENEEGKAASSGWQRTSAEQLSLSVAGRPEAEAVPQGQQPGGATHCSVSTVLEISAGVERQEEERKSI